MKRFAGFYGSWDPRKRWYRFQKLERAVLDFGAEPGGHRAAADALACRVVVMGMAATPPPLVAPDVAVPLGGADLPGPRPRSGVVAAATEASQSDVDVHPAAVSRAQLRWANAARVFLALLEELPAALRERPGACGVWSPRELAAHCAGWEEEAARRLRLIAAKPDIADRSYQDIDGFNAASVAVRARLSWTETLDDLARNGAALGAAAGAIPDDPRTREWLNGRARDFEMHSAGLRQWLEELAPGDAAERTPGSLAALMRGALDHAPRESAAGHGRPRRPGA
jgi:hypothetical protein